MDDEKRDTRWKPGQSGNPKGRPRKGDALAEVIREKVDPQQLIDVALAVMADQKSPASVKLQAASFLAERGWQRPTQSHELLVSGAEDPEEEDLSRLTTAELRGSRLFGLAGGPWSPWRGR
jgi:hypothetical protein